MQLHGKKICTFLAIFMMIAILLSSYVTALPARAASATPTDSGLKLGVYKSGSGIINAYGEKLDFQYTSYFLRKYGKLPPPVPLSISNTSYTEKQTTKQTSIVEQSRSITNSCGEEGAPSDKAYEIRDIIDKLPTIPADRGVSDPFLLLASEVSYREENGLPVTSDDLVKNCSENFNPATGGMAYNLMYLNYQDNWPTILKAYQARYGGDYPAIRDALNRLKDQATQYAKAHKIPIGVRGELYEAPAYILDDPEWPKHYVLMPPQQWGNTTFADDGVDSDINDPQKWLDAIHFGLDIAGLVPIIGEPIDGLNAIMYYAEGDKVNALLSAGAMVPYVGDGVTAAKLTARGVKYADGLADVSKIIKRIEGFDTFKALKKALRPLPKGEVWHHFVEQCQIKKSGFFTKKIQNINNVVAVGHGKGSIHAKVSGIFGSKIEGVTGDKTLRDWLAGKSSEEQFEWGMKILKRFGDVVKNPKTGPGEPVWIFKPFKK